MNVRVFAIACALPILLSGCISTNPPKPPAEAYQSMDAFLAQLAKRVQSGMSPGGTAPEDFQIVVTQAMYPIGTVLRPSSTIPIDYSACVPTADIKKWAMPSMFPQYKLSKSLAVNFGLDNNVISELVDFGVDYKNSGDINLTVEGPEMQSLADRELLAIANTSTCISAISPGPVWVVRGYVLGKRTFSLQRQNSLSTSAKVTDIGSFKISANPGSPSVSIADKVESGFLQIVSQLSPPTVTRTPTAEPNISSAPTSSSTGTATASIGQATADTGQSTQAPPPGTQVVTSFEKPKATAGITGRVFIQRDRNDLSGKSEAILQALTQDPSLRVDPRVEAIKHENMPSKPTVRYFNAGDSTIAERVLERFKKIYPDAVAMPITLPAPQGQVEVWLPRT
jgi:hypothetical protein